MSLHLHLQGTAITFEEEEVMIGGSILALLADIEGVVAIEPGQFARIPTPITFTGNGCTIALIDMHAGRISHALDQFDENAPSHGEYFLPKMGVETTVFVDVVNETGATVMIRPGARIGTMTLINTANDVSDEQPLNSVSDPCLSVTANYQPVHLDPENLPAYTSKGGSGVALRADIAIPVCVAAGQSIHIPTGFMPTIPAGFEGNVRSAAELPNGILANQGSFSFDKPIIVILINASGSDFTIHPGDQIAQFVFAPTVMAALNFTSNQTSLGFTGTY